MIYPDRIEHGIGHPYSAYSPMELSSSLCMSQEHAALRPTFQGLSTFIGSETE